MPFSQTQVARKKCPKSIGWQPAGFTRRSWYKVQGNQQQKLATCFLILLQNELSSDVRYYTSPRQTCLATSDITLVQGMTPA